MSELRRTPSQAATHYARRTVAEVRGGVDRSLLRAGIRSTDGLRLPDFLGVGAQKAGSTWLHANLARHPDLFLPREKELHHFDWHRVETLREYAGHFTPAGSRLAGEITPGYSAMSTRRVRWVRRVLPDARILLVVRDPVDRTWSQLVMDAGRDPHRSATTLTIAEVRRRLDQRGARRRSELTEAIERWEAAFGRQLWLGRYEDLTGRPEVLLRSVLTHLDVDAGIDLSTWPLRDRFNAGSGAVPPTPIRELLEERFGAQRDALDRLVPRLTDR